MSQGAKRVPDTPETDGPSDSIVACAGLRVWSERAPPAASSEEANVKGRVTIRGKPATGGEISFDPANTKRPNEIARRAAIGKDGTYTVKTLVGNNAVRISFPGMERDRELGSAEQSFEVKPGENQFDFQLPPPAQP
jgi:hypothetical protein